MHVSFFVRGNVIISCYARGEGTPYDGLYGEAPSEIPERYLINKYLYGEAPPRGPTPYTSRKRSKSVTDSYSMTVRVSSS